MLSIAAPNFNGWKIAWITSPERAVMSKDIFTPPSMGSRVMALRKAKNMKPADLSRAAKITQPSLWAIENDVTKPDKIRASTLLRLAAVLDSTPEYIRDGAGDPHTATPGDARELLEIYNAAPEHIRDVILAAARALRNGS